MQVESSNNQEIKSLGERMEKSVTIGKLDFDNIPVPKDLSELTAHLRQIFSSDTVNVDYVIKLLQNYKSNPKDWRKYAKYDPHKYTRTLIDEGNGKYNLLLLCWAESQGSSIHDHSDAHCFMKCLDGELSETKYEWPKESDAEDSTNKMKEIKITSLKKNEVCYINDEIGLHRIENKSHSKAGVTLHIYIPPFNECSSFDENSGKSKKCQITFTSKCNN